MADSTILPGARARLIQQDGTTSPEFFRLFQALARAAGLTSDLQQQIVQITQILDGGGAYLSTSTRIGSSDGTIAVQGTLAGGVVDVSLYKTGVTPGDYGGGVKIIALTLDAYGRVTTASDLALIPGNGISFDTDPDTGAVTISVNSFVADNRVTEAGDTRVTPSGDIRITR